MSISIMSQVWNLDLPSTEKLILLAFADYANDEGRCYPSTDIIAHKSGVSRRHAVRVVKDLIDRGLIEVEDPGGGRGNRRVVRVRPEKGDTMSRFTPRGGRGKPESGPAVKGDTMSPNSGERVTSGAIKGDTMSPEPLEEPSEGTSYDSEESGEPDVEKSEKWNARLAPLARELGGEKNVADILAWCRDRVRDTDRAARILQGAQYLKESGRLSGWIEPGQSMGVKALHAQSPDGVPLSRQAEAAYFALEKRKGPRKPSGPATIHVEIGGAA